MQISHRNSLFDKDKTFTLNEKGIDILLIKNENKDLIPFKDILNINLIHIPGVKYIPESFVCSIGVKNRPTIKLSNRTFIGVGNIAEQNDRYNDFVIALHDLTKQSDITFTKGASKGLSQGLNIFLIIASMLFLIISFFTFIENKYQVSLVMIIGCITTITTRNTFAKAYKKEPYNPEDIPVELLP